MANESKSDNQVWWIVGIVVLLLLVLCLCLGCLAGGLLVCVGQRAQGAGFEVPAPRAEVTVPALPAPLEPTPEFVPDYQLQQGALILSIEPGSPAEGVGWQPGDIIVAVDGRKLSQSLGLREALAGHEPGDLVTIEWWSRETREITSTRVQLGEDPKGSGGIYLGIEYRMLE